MKVERMKLKDLDRGDKFYPRSQQKSDNKTLFTVRGFYYGRPTIRCYCHNTKDIVYKSALLDVMKVFTENDF